MTIDGSFNEFLHRANRINFFGSPLNISFFPAPMGYLKRTSQYFHRQRNSPDRMMEEAGGNGCEEDECVGAYFGTDIEVVKELAVRLNFTARLIGPADGLDYGFKVSGQNGWR